LKQVKKKDDEGGTLPLKGVEDTISLIQGTDCLKDNQQLNKESALGQCTCFLS
jgi:hypothetical protein